MSKKISTKKDIYNKGFTVPSWSTDLRCPTESVLKTTYHSTIGIEFPKINDKKLVPIDDITLYADYVPFNYSINAESSWWVSVESETTYTKLYNTNYRLWERVVHKAPDYYTRLEYTITGQSKQISTFYSGSTVFCELVLINPAYVKSDGSIVAYLQYREKFNNTNGAIVNSNDFYLSANQTLTINIYTTHLNTTDRKVY